MKMRRFMLKNLLPLLALCLISGSLFAQHKDKAEKTSGMVKMTSAMFKQKVFDYTKEKNWKYNGKELMVIDLYADWCAPCRQMAPVMEALAKEYAGKVHFYKVNVDEEQELAAGLGASSIPMFVFIAPGKEPRAAAGATSKEGMKKMIRRYLEVETPESQK